VVELLTGGPAAPRVRARLLGDTNLHAPQVFDLEVLSAIRRMLLRGEVEEGRALVAAAALADLRVRRWSHVPLRDRVWELRHNVTAYDAAYVALAERFRCALVTCDARLARASGHSAKIELFSAEA